MTSIKMNLADGTIVNGKKMNDNFKIYNMESNLTELLSLLKKARAESERLMYRCNLSELLDEKVTNVHYHVCEALDEIL